MIAGVLREELVDESIGWVSFPQRGELNVSKSKAAVRAAGKGQNRKKVVQGLIVGLWLYVFCLMPSAGVKSWAKLPLVC